MSGHRAAVDVGTNSCRLLVVDERGHALVRETEITRLGQGVDARGRLDDRALSRTLEVIDRYHERWQELDVATDAVTIAATSAVRDARDRERFLRAVEERTGVRVVALSGDEEARTTFRGVAARLDVPPPVVVLDVGGGSTELIVGDGDGRVAATVSMQLGSVRVTERLLTDDPPTPEQVRAARQEVDARLSDARDRLLERGADPSAGGALVGVAGTVTSLAALHLELDRYDPDRVHGSRLSREGADALTERLLALPARERTALGPLAPGREDVIAGGALIVQGVLHRFGYPELVASEADILDGLVLH